jgi:hypothetical protein
VTDISFKLSSGDKWEPSLHSDLQKESTLIRELLSVSQSIERMLSVWELVPPEAKRAGIVTPTGVAVYGRPSFYCDCISLVESQLGRLKTLADRRKAQDITGVLPQSTASVHEAVWSSHPSSLSE